MKLIGEILAETCDLTHEVISQALKIQSSNGLRLGEILVNQNLISKPDLHNALSLQSRMNRYGLDERSAWQSGIPGWLKVFFLGTGAVVSIWILSGILINLAKAFGH
jgi:hypothetical protein